MSSWTHPEAVLHPISRPGRSVYFGPEGVREMLADMRQVLGGFDIVVDDVAELDDGLVVAHGRLVLDDGRAFERVCHLRVRDGLVVSFDPAETEGNEPAG
jgi:hypothetical protein